jgi:single-stranded DNA-binding protein
MTVAVLISGSIFKPPQQRTSQSGKQYVVATIKTTAAADGSSDFWSALAFGTTAGEELLRLTVGERLAIQGSMKLDLYAAADGAKKISRTVFVDHVLPLRAAAKERKPAKEEPQGQSGAAPASPAKEPETGAPPFFSDTIPFFAEWR